MYSLEWLHVLSVDVTHDVAHLHCHQGPEQDDAVLILVGYNGIAYPSLTFPQVIQIINQIIVNLTFLAVIDVIIFGCIGEWTPPTRMLGATTLVSTATTD